MGGSECLLGQAFWSWWIGGMAYLRSSLCIASDVIMDIYLVEEGTARDTASLYYHLLSKLSTHTLLYIFERINTNSSTRYSQFPRFL